MLDSIRNRFLLAFALAVIVAIAINVGFTSANRTAVRKGADAAAAWKARTGVDLAALPKPQPQKDSADARALDALLVPLQLRLGGEPTEQQRNFDRDNEHDRELRDFVRTAIRSGTPDAPPLPPSLVTYVEQSAATLDAVADYLAAKRDIRWREDDSPRIPLNTYDHLTMHRLLLARGFLALERHDTATATRMLQASRKLKEVLEARHEQTSQFVAVSVERMQLALLRRGGPALGVEITKPLRPIRDRYLTAVSSEARRALTNARTGRTADGGDDDPTGKVVQLLASSKVEMAVSSAVTQAAGIVDEIRRSPDPCRELSKTRRREPIFWEGFESLDAVEAWRRFAMLDIDRAVTEAVLTGHATSPCQSVLLTVREEKGTRIVESRGLPEESEVVFAPPSRFTTTR